ncbi:hypothetical protein IC762_31050 [Bradyrhizobium genosp. L]|uniref:hypothetical protein n=1 Tax=Bradyrhizobium genosp. L TaxID=83637 RepID=UPI0018A2A0FD|nr:hypothetical protein [Bradyrhizobium genosp. L]QPF84022.1 hypothetical protein IC762_31050 [Bradyrhizobium genosp. L]
MLSYLKKFVMDILPSVAATIIGAYIVNHYIVSKPDPSATAAISAAADPKADAKTAAKPAEKSTVVGSLPEAGVKAKGMSERTLIERAASEKAQVTEKSATEKSATEKSVAEKSATEKSGTEKPAEKSADVKAPDAPADTASIPADSRHHPVTPKAIAKLTPPASVEAAVTPEDGRDANDLARAAIERLRKENPARAQEQHPTDAARLPEGPRGVTAPSVRPLPPPIMVSSPTDQSVADQSSQQRPPYADGQGSGSQNSNRLTPPADIPVPILQPPLDLRAEATVPQPKDHTSVADDMLSSVKSVFHAVLPK